MQAPALHLTMMLQSLIVSLSVSALLYSLQLLYQCESLMSCASLLHLPYAKPFCWWCAALGEIDPAAHNFKVLLRHVISRVMDAIPSDLIDKELGIQPASATAAAVEEIAPDAQQAQQPQQAQQAQQADQTELVDGADKEGSSSQAQQAKQGQQAKQAAQNGDAEEDEEGQERLPLFTHKVMALVQHLLKYKVRSSFLPSTAYSAICCLFCHLLPILPSAAYSAICCLYCYLHTTIRICRQGCSSSAILHICKQRLPMAFHPGLCMLILSHELTILQNCGCALHVSSWHTQVLLQITIYASILMCTDRLCA